MCDHTLKIFHILLLQENKFSFYQQYRVVHISRVDKLHIWKKNFFWKFFWGFLSLYYVVLAQIQKNQYVLKTSKSCLFGTINIYLIWRFVSILLKKFFFFNFWKSPFLSIIRRDLTKKFFWKFQKKNFKIFFFFPNV